MDPACCWSTPTRCRPCPAHRRGSGRVPRIGLRAWYSKLHRGPRCIVRSARYRPTAIAARLLRARPSPIRLRWEGGRQATGSRLARRATIPTSPDARLCLEGRSAFQCSNSWCWTIRRRGRAHGSRRHPRIPYTPGWSPDTSRSGSSPPLPDVAGSRCQNCRFPSSPVPRQATVPCPSRTGRLGSGSIRGLARCESPAPASSP